MRYLIFLILFISSSLFSQDYYLSPLGDDNNNGLSQATAWKTSTKINNFVFPTGSRLFINGEILGGLSFDHLDGLTLLSTNSSGTIRTLSNTEHGVFIYNKGNIEVSNLTILGTGNIVLDQEGNGVYFYSDDNKRHRDIKVTNCTVKHFSGTGITTNFIWENYNQVRAYTGGYDNITFDKCRADSNGYAGIATYGIWPKKNNTNVRITNCETHYNKGIPGRQPHSGHGIVAAGFVGGLIENCKASWNGWQYSTGNIGIWVHDCDQAIIQYCESWRTKSASTIDGGGFDLDGGTTNSIIQFCYSHENDGEGYLAYPYSYGDAPLDLHNKMDNNTFRYNISVNDAQKNPYGSLTVGGAFAQSNLFIYNNTFINPIKGGVITKVGANVINMVVKNNLFISNNRSYMWGDVKNNVFVTDSLMVEPGNIIPDASNVRIKSIVMDEKFYTNDPNVWNKALELPNLPLTDFYGKPMYLQRDIGATELQLDNPLPIKLLYFNGVQRGKKAHLSWETSMEMDFSHFILQSSSDGLVWRDLRRVEKRGAFYKYTEVIDLVQGVNHFRLKSIDKDGSFSYSKSVRITYSVGPVNVRIYNVAGQLVRYYKGVFNFNPKLPTGVYIFQIEYPDGYINIEKRFVQ